MLARRVQHLMPMRWRQGLAATLLLLGAASVAAQSPSAGWQTFETANFRIHFPKPFEAWARRVASRIESIHARVTEYVGYSPKRPIDVIVEDPAAAANGVAFPFLDRPVIVLWTTPPESESSLGYYNDWPDLVLTHEMTHIVHLLRPRSQSRGLLARFSPLPIGPVLLKSPRWVIEGYATLVEGALTGSGRPQGSFRAMVMRRLAMEGKLPEYRQLSSLSGWLGGAAPYLVGSTFLEWLEAREGSGSLQRLWKRLTSRRGGGFASAFRGVFGESPADLYDRFRAEITARALEEEKRLKGVGLAEGVIWQRLEGATASPQVSPDGRYLLARREAERGRGEIVVWDIAETDAERQMEERRRQREERLMRDPEEVAEKPPTPRPRRPRWTLANINGHATTQPRWMPDGKNVLFSRKASDADGVLRADLYLWNPEHGSVRRITRLADVAMADPAPDGRFLFGVANRYGISRLVRIETASGRVETFPPNLEREDPWRVWIHPRVSPDGSRIAALVHSGSRWRLMVGELKGKALRELTVSGAPVGPPAWTPDGSRLLVATDATGVWNLESISVEGGAAMALTRVTGGALAPAPTPDGKEAFYADATAHGFDLRRLRLDSPQIAGAPAPPDSAHRFPILPPPAVEVVRASDASVGASHPYRLTESHVVRLYLAQSLGTSGTTFQAGFEGSDVIGRWHWVALGSVGSVSGPRGGTISLAYRGWPVILRGQIFDALERPGAQSVLHRPEFDQARLGGFAEGLWQLPIDGGQLRVSAGAGSSRVEALSLNDVFRRDVASARVEGSMERSRGHRGVIFEWDLAISGGQTDGSSWTQTLEGARLTALVWKFKLRFAGRLGQTSGSPTRFDLLSIGGAPSSIFPEGLDRNRLLNPALPSNVQVGRKAEGWRVELAPYSLPMALFYERARAWTLRADAPDAVKLYGAELRFDGSLLPFSALGSFNFYAGIARIESRLPSFARTRLYTGIVYHP